MTVAESKKVLAAILACVAIFGLTLGLSRPLLSIILESRDISRTLIGLNATMPAFGMLLSAPIIPMLTQRFGMKAFLIACLAIDLCAFLCYPLFDFLYAWFAIGVVTGAAGNCLLVASETWINEVVVDKNRGKILGFYNAIFAGTLAVGPLVIPVIGIHGWAPFLVGAFFMLLASIPLFWIDSVKPIIQGKPSFSITSFIIVAPVLIYAVLLFSWSQTAGAALLPIYGIRNGLDNASAALMLTVSGIGAVVFAYPVGCLADKMDRFTLLMMCGIAIVAGALLLPLVIQHKQLLWVLLFFWGASFSGLYIVVLTMIGQRFRGINLTVANAALGMIWGIGSLTGSPITGLAMDIWDPEGFPIVFSIASVGFICFALIRWILAKDKRAVI